MWSFGVDGQYQQLSSRDNTSARGFMTNLGATYHFEGTHRDDPWIRLGTGYRFVWENQPSGATDTSIARHGFELAALKLGYEMRVSEDVGIAPVLGADLDMFLWESPSNGPGRVLSSAEFGTFVFVGLEGRLDFGGTRSGGVAPSEEPPPP